MLQVTCHVIPHDKLLMGCSMGYTPSPPPAPLLIKNQAPTSLKTPPSPHRLFDLQYSLDKLMHFLPQQSDFVPLRNRFYSFRAQTGSHHHVDPDSCTVVAREVDDLKP